MDIEDCIRYTLWEYKKGKPKLSEEDKLQLAAQTMCLEEMFCTEIPEGAIFYGETRRRETVAITEDLRDEVVRMFQGDARLL